ncbi:MAG: hypothetical protein AB9842_04225 [Bacteroidales bacterium]
MEYNDNGELKIPLFPYYLKYFGLIFIILGILAGYLYFFGGKPTFFESKVFALVTAYLKTRYFVIIQTNLLDEMAAIFLVSGLGLISFSKEKHEKPEYQSLRFLAMLWAAYCSIILWILVFMFFYGYMIFMISPIVFICFFIFYNILFRYYITRRN